jgi:phosphoribosyl 1,2-cyclic phosphate phosphodiesterase
MSRPAANYVQSVLDTFVKSEEAREKMSRHMVIRPLAYFRDYRIGDLLVETPAGNHTAWGLEEKSINYLLTLPEGTRMLYALDTGYYLDPTWEYLQGRRVDVLIMDCTFAGRTDRGDYPSGHLDLQSFLRMLEKMAAMGFIDESTRLYASHFNPHQGLSHHEIQERFDASPFSVTVAYDGLRVAQDAGLSDPPR